MSTWNLVFHMKSGQSFPVKFDTELNNSTDVVQHFTDILNRGNIQNCIFQTSATSAISITLNEVEALEIIV